MGIEKINKRKIYQLIVEDIKSSIENGELQQGDPLPTIKKLTESYDVSISSVREALVALEAEGIIVKRNSRYYEVL